jgi:hypothetical protein
MNAVDPAWAVELLPRVPDSSTSQIADWRAAEAAGIARSLGFESSTSYWERPYLLRWRVEAREDD